MMSCEERHCCWIRGFETVGTKWKEKVTMMVWHKDLDTLWWNEWWIWVYQMWYNSCHRSLGVRFSKCNFSFFLWKPKNIASLLISLGVLSLYYSFPWFSHTCTTDFILCTSCLFPFSFVLISILCNVKRGGLFLLWFPMKTALISRSKFFDTRSCFSRHKVTLYCI